MTTRIEVKIGCIEIGDWIRYQHGGQLVVGVVAYIAPRASWDSTPWPVTVEHGPIDPKSVLEIRGGPADE
jgi:hypothetical protein